MGKRDEAVAIASRKSQGTEVSFGDRTLKVKALEFYYFSDVDICLMSAGGSVSKEWSPKIGALGPIVIDNSSCWRYDAEVPLVVPEINADAIRQHQGIIANPNCAAILSITPLWPIHRVNPIRRLILSTYQAASGAGAAAISTSWWARRTATCTRGTAAAGGCPARSRRSRR